MKYIKKPIPIEAYQLGSGLSCPDWYMDALIDKTIITHCDVERSLFDISPNPHITATIKTLEGDHSCKSGDYIIKGIKGELYPCRQDIFEESYEKVPE